MSIFRRTFDIIRLKSSQHFYLNEKLIKLPLKEIKKYGYRNVTYRSLTSSINLIRSPNFLLNRIHYSKEFQSFPLYTAIIGNYHRQFQTTPVTLVPILPTILFAIPLCIPYFLIIRVAATKFFHPSTTRNITKTLLSILLAFPVIYFFTSEITPNTDRRRHMLLWPWEKRELIKTAEKCVQEVIDSSINVPISDPLSQLVNNVCKNLWDNGVTVENRMKHLKEPTVHLISNDDILDGVAYPSSAITLTTGWLRLIDYDENLLAAIIAHEMAHILQDHAAEFFGMSYLMKGLANLGETIKSLIPNGLYHKFFLHDQRNSIDGNQWQRPLLFLQNHSQILEREADILGQEIMARAGYDPANALQLWQLMVDLEGLNDSSPGLKKENLSFPLTSKSSHPYKVEGHGVRHNTQISKDTTLVMHPSRQNRVKYLTENLVQVQVLYENALKEQVNKNR
ncbi:hypothetical protein G9A89_023379 [Geosiphon pyriformis]|nr:hypothetical protein G9A89_023379 [Geosiphon pyriformis]